ncbi:MAG: hypothetical protein LBI54_10010, partial [Lachnospiraceae bacterium]|nr:hypothetical protein [Lachnospiraceae bacterium]
MKKQRTWPRFLALFMPFAISANMAGPVFAADVSGNALVAESSGIQLTAAMQAAKAELAEIDLAGQLAGLAADYAYVDHEVVYPTASGAEAERVAAAYQGKVTSYSEGIAVIKVPESTQTVIARAQDMGNDFPAVHPNYIYRLTSETYSEEEIAAAVEEETDTPTENEPAPAETETDPAVPDDTPAENETDPAV